MNNVMLAFMVGALTVGGALYALKTDCKADKALLDANANLQAQLLILAAKPEIAYRDAARALDDEKKRLETKGCR